MVETTFNGYVLSAMMTNDTPDSMSCSSPDSTACTTFPGTVSPLSQGKPKEREHDEDRLEHQLRTAATSVVFDPVVLIHSIPPRSSYTHPEDIWSSFEEIEEMRTRNWLEFAAEGFDWRNVADEADMLHADAENCGRKEHPIHSNPMLGLALRRRLPYPKARRLFDEVESDCDGAVCRPTEGLFIERPASPFVGFDEDD